MLIAARNAILAGGGSQPSGYWGLCFTAEQANSTVAMKRAGSSAPSLNLLYSINPADPTSWAEFVVGTTTVTLANVGDKVWLKADQNKNIQIGSSARNYNYFTLGGMIAASGNIMSLLDGDNETYDASGASYIFCSLFRNCTSLISPPDLPATALGVGCYRNMFYGCTSLTKSPTLPYATVQSNGVNYAGMFQNCSALTEICTNQTQAFGTATNSPNYQWVSGVAATGTFYCPTPKIGRAHV